MNGLNKSSRASERYAARARRPPAETRAPSPISSHERHEDRKDSNSLHTLLLLCIERAPVHICSAAFPVSKAERQTHNAASKF